MCSSAWTPVLRGLRCILPGHADGLTGVDAEHQAVRRKQRCEPTN